MNHRVLPVLQVRAVNRPAPVVNHPVRLVVLQACRVPQARRVAHPVLQAHRILRVHRAAHRVPQVRLARLAHPVHPVRAANHPVHRAVLQVPQAYQAVRRVRAALPVHPVPVVVPAAVAAPARPAVAQVHQIAHRVPVPLYLLSAHHRRLPQSHRAAHLSPIAASRFRRCPSSVTHMGLSFTTGITGRRLTVIDLT